MKILYASPFLMRHRATIDIGWAILDELKKILSKENPISIEYVDTSEIKITTILTLLNTVGIMMG